MVDVWEDWIVFPPDFTAELRARLEGAAILDSEPKNEKAAADDVEERSQVFASRFKASSFQPAQTALEVAITGVDCSAAGEDGEPMDQEDDLDGEPVEDDVDGEPLIDDDGDPVDENDVDGEPMDDDIDGVPADV